MFYTQDLSRPADRPRWYRDISSRFTWQMAAKHKVNISSGYQNNCNCLRGVEITSRPDATSSIHFRPNVLTIASWQNPATNRLLLEAATAYS